MRSFAFIFLLLCIVSSPKAQISPAVSFGAFGGFTYTDTILGQANNLNTAATSIRYLVQPTCINSTNGSVEAVVTNAVGNVRYNWQVINTAGIPVDIGETTRILTNVAGWPVTLRVEVRDDGGNFLTATFDVRARSSLSEVTLTATPVTCFGGNNGTLQTTAIGGVAPLQYSLVDPLVPSIPALLTGVAPGFYQARVTDALGCVATSNYVEVVSPFQPLVRLLGNHSCIGQSDGSINLEEIGGLTPPYSYVWNTGATTNQLFNVPGGIYTLTVTDANGCQASANETIENVSCEVTTTVQSPVGRCGSGQDGVLSMTPPAEAFTNFPTNWTHAWKYEGGIGLPRFYDGLTVGNLPPGRYRAYSQFNLWPYTRHQSRVVILGVSDSLQASVQVLAPSCDTAFTGRAQVTASGGSRPLSYIWAQTSSTGHAPSNLAPGAQTVRVQDPSGCSVVLPFTVGQRNCQPFVVLLAVRQPYCASRQSGILAARPQGGLAPYTIQWQKDGQPIAGAVDTLLNNVGPGTYNVLVTDAEGQTRQLSTPLIVADLPALAADVVRGPVSSCTATDGWVAVTNIRGGQSPYSINWSNGSMTDTLRNLPAGTQDFSFNSGHSVVVRDAQGCTHSFTNVMPEATMLCPPFDLKATPVGGCGTMANGRVEITNIRFTDSITSIRWYRAMTPLPQFDNQRAISGLTPGEYDVEIKTASMPAWYTARSSAIVNPLQAPEVIEWDKQPSCTFFGTGKIKLSIKWGTPPFTIAWSNSSNTNLGMSVQPSGTYQTNRYETDWAVGFLPGNYHATVTDVSGCSTTIPFTINPTYCEPLLATSTVVTIPGCHPSNGGVLRAQAQGGFPPYTYQWRLYGGAALPGQTALTASNLSEGVYQLEVVDSVGNRYLSDSIPLRAHRPTVELVTVASSCSPGANGSATVQASGGMFPYTYTWSNGAAGASVGGLGSGTYTVEVRDAAQCASSLQVVVPAFAFGPLTVSTTATCSNKNEGTALAQATNGIAPYSFYWNTGDTTASLSGMSSAATYQVTVTDQRGCSLQQSVQIPGRDTAQVVLGTSSTPWGDTTGFMTVRSVSGSAPFQYAWNTGATSATIGNLSPGLYTLTVTDAVGCQSRRTDSVYTSDGVYILRALRPVSACGNGSDGALEVTNAPLPGATYAWYRVPWEPISSGNSPVQHNLPPGRYHVQITLANGTVIYTPVFELITSGRPQMEVRELHAACGTATTGGALVAGSGGAGTFTFLWSNGQSGPRLQQVAAGTYQVTIADSLCSATFSVTVPLGSMGLPQISATSVACAGARDGTATVQPAGGTAPYRFQWSNGDTTSTITGLVPGLYSVSVTDAIGCTETVTVNVVTRPALVASVSAQDGSCSGGGGTIQASANGGTAPYTYSWSHGATGANLVDLFAGVYTATVTDSLGCTDTASGIISLVGSNLSARATATPVSCFGGNNGTITASLSGGVGTLSYTWSHGGTGLVQNNLSAGVYTITVTDSVGCRALATASVSQPASLRTTVTATTIACFGEQTGRVAASTAGGVTPYRYHWNTGGTADTLSGLPAGNYRVIVTDARGCQVADSAQIIEPSQLSVSLTKTDIGCFGGNSGTIRSTVTGGTAPYRFLWTPGNRTSESLNGLPAGNYSLRVTDQRGCNTSSSVTITQPPAAIQVSAIASPVRCTGAADGTISLNVQHAVGPVRYRWNTGATTAALNGLFIGTYSVTVIDSAGCSAAASATVIQPPRLVATASSTAAFCAGGNGTLTGAASGGTAPYTYRWSNGSTTPNMGGVGAGNYTLTVTDANGCSAQASASVAQPGGSGIMLNMTKTDIRCFGQATGAVRTNVVGGTGPYQYNWQPAAPNADSITGVFAGRYVLEVTDSRGCVGRDSVEIIQPTASVQLTMSKVDVSCGLMRDGSATAQATGGVAPYTYLWNNGGTTSTIAGLDRGVFSVRVTDAAGCTNADSVEVRDPGILQIPDVQTTSIRCWGGADGTARAIVWNGTPPYSFSWTTSSQNTVSVTGQPAGWHYVTVTDARGCTAGRQFEIRQPLRLTAPIGRIGFPCSSDTAGVLNVLASGGTRPYTFLWSTGHTDSFIVARRPMTYRVTVTDANGCSVTDSINLDPPIPISVNVRTYPERCFRAANGAMEIQTSGNGSHPHSYSLNGAPFGPGIGNFALFSGLPQGNHYAVVASGPGQVCKDTVRFAIAGPADTLSYTLQITPLCSNATVGSASIQVAGGSPPYRYEWTYFSHSGPSLVNVPFNRYWVEVKDTFDCSIRVPVDIVAPTPIVSSPLINHVLCRGSNNGTILPQISGGRPPYTYQWSNNSNASLLAGLTGGTYSLVVTDSIGCSATFNYQVNEPSAELQATVSVTPVSCFGFSDGAAALNATGGTAPYTYTWQLGSANFVMQQITNRPALSFTATITDANNCRTTLSGAITQPSQLQATVSVTNALCFGQSNGSATITPSGATAPYTYLWSTGATTATATGLPMGNASVTVRDANNCSVSRSITITQPNLLTVTLTMTPVSCAGGNNGSISSIVNGGTAPYTYSWSNNTTLPGATGLSAGVYTLIVTDAQGCTATASATVTQPTPLLVSATPSHVTCNGASSGSILASASGGTGPYVYNWSTGATAVNPLINLPAGTYTVTVRDARNCSQATTVTVNQATPLNVTGTVTAARCFGDSSGAVTLNVSGSNPPYAYLWSNGATIQSLTGVPARTYSVRVIDNLGCSRQSSFTVTQPIAPLQVQLSPTHVAVCNGDQTGRINAFVSGGTAPYTYLWSGGQTTPNITGLPAGAYSVRVADANNCSASLSATITQPAPVTVNLGPDRRICPGQSIVIDLTDPNIVSYNWQERDRFGVVRWLSGDPVVTLRSAGTYWVTVTTRTGCVVRSNDLEVTFVPGVTIRSEFVVATQTFNMDTVVFVNITNLTLDSVRWYLPPDVTMISQSEIMMRAQFRDTGIYQVRMRTYKSGCFAEQVKNVIVTERTGLGPITMVEEPLIRNFTVAPNPSRGSFRATITLSQSSPVHLRLIDIVSSRIIDQRSLPASEMHLSQYTLAIPAGTYLLLVETPRGNAIHKVIIH